VNGTPVDAPQVAPLRLRLELHAVGELAVPHDAPVSHVYELLRALSDMPGSETQLTSRLKASGVDRVSVSLTATDFSPQPPAPPAPPAPPQPPATHPPPGPRLPAELAQESLGTGGLLRGDPMREYGSAPVEGVGDIIKEEPPSDSDISALPTRGSAEVSASSYDLDAPAASEPDNPPAPERRPPPPDQPPRPERMPPRPQPLPRPETSPPPPPPPPPAPPPSVPSGSVPAAGRAPRQSSPDITREAQRDEFAPAVARAKTTDDVLAELEAQPTGPTAADRLAVVSRQVETALAAGRIEDVLRIVDAIVRIEDKAPEAGRRAYAIALKRMMSKQLLDRVAKLAPVPQHRDAAVRVLSRGGEEGVAILLEELAAAPSVEQRRDLFAVVSRMKKGQDQLVQLLEHHQWYVARNVAELLGELGLESSIPALARQLGHADERVRGAVALALAKIGSGGAVEPLRRALRDAAPSVRLQVALGVGGRKAAALAMPMVVAIEEEQDIEVARELMLALGRVGSPDAVQALIKFGQPGGRLFGRKPTARRLAAVEALRVAATPAAIGTLQGLSDDSDKEVRSAARAALAELKR
jgi:hypothetical protein